MNSLFLVLSIAVLGAVDSDSERIPKETRERVAKRVESGNGIGVAIGVVDAQGSTFHFVGTYSTDDSRPITADTIFEIGSITKAFTSLLLADMVERQKVALNDPVQKFIPADVQVPKSSDRSITLGDLASHQSGLPRMPDNFEPKDPDNPYADYSADRLYSFLSGCKLEREVGAEYEYSNLGAGLLGLALARQAGTTYEQLVVDRICRPLGMNDTRITLTAEQMKRLAPGHANRKRAKNWDLDALAGAGALRSTTKDMVQFLGANLGLVEGPWSAAMRAARQPRFETGQAGVQVALGWHVNTLHGATIIWHNGGTGGYRSFCGFREDQRRGVVILTNATDEFDDIGMHLLEPKYEVAEPRAVAAIDEKTLKDYEGYYELQPGVVFHITRDGAQLHAQLTGQSKIAIFAESPDKFFCKEVDAQISFVRGPDGAVSHLVLHQNGDRQAKRLTDYQPPARKEINVDPAILARYVGKYELAQGVGFDVILEGGQLKVKLANQPRFPVFAESETKFFYKVVEAQLTFVLDEAGKTKALILHQGGMNQTAKKVE